MAQLVYEWRGWANPQMARADQIRALIRSHAEGDDGRFYAVAMQVAAQAARSGHGKFAQDLRELVDQARQRSQSKHNLRAVPLAQPRGELAELMVAGYPQTRLADMSLDQQLSERILRVILEQQQKARLLQHGFAPLRKLLLVGPPGTGKTMTSAALAGELGLPLFTIQLDGLVTKYLGETAAKLRLVFEAMQATRGVYFFDEFDALGGHRGRGNDVGEARRILNSFLQFLETDPSESLIVAATNHSSLLDRALFRRFDIVLEYPLPSQEIAIRVMQARLGMMDTSGIDWNLVGSEAGRLSHAEVSQACDQAAKNAILSDRVQVNQSDLLAALRDRACTHDREVSS